MPLLSLSPEPLGSCAAGLLQLPGSQSDERRVALIHGGQRGAFGALVARYGLRILGSAQDAENALQDVVVFAFNAIVADERTICVRPWLYRIARNRCLDKLRGPASVGVGAMGTFCAEKERSQAEKVVARERLCDLDMQALPVRQSKALSLREVDALSYRQIALATRTTTPGVNSLLVRARAGLVDSVAARETSPALTGLSAAPRRSRRTGKSTRAVSHPTARAAANASA